MKIKLTILSLGLAAITMSFTSSNKSKSSETSFRVDATKSTITWTGKKIGGSHTGNIKINSGALVVNGDAIKGGNFVIDMTSITNTDLEGEWNDKLVGHLKSDDFFSVEKHPTTKFEIINVNAASADRVNVEGKLTIKGITNTVTFPASISKKENVLVAVATIKVDRSKYDVRYGSKSFFEGIGDKAIDDDFELQVNLIAIK